MPQTPGECNAKIALVTGASRGIGAAIAERLAAEGARVALCARSLDQAPENLPGTLREMVAKIETRGGEAVAIQADVADPDDRVRMVSECEKQLGPIDILVNNAAHAPYRPFLKFSERDFQRTYEIDVRAPFHVCQLVLPGMRKRKRGWILNISSATAVHPAGPPYIPWHREGGYHLYGASKAALDRFTTGLAAEFYEDRIAVNSLAPVAAVATPGMLAISALPDFMDDSMFEPVEAMAEAALVLCSGNPETLTGGIHASLQLLQKLGRAVRTLDGTAEYVK